MSDSGDHRSSNFKQIIVTRTLHALGGRDWENSRAKKCYFKVNISRPANKAKGCIVYDLYYCIFFISADTLPIPKLYYIARP